MTDTESDDAGASRPRSGGAETQEAVDRLLVSVSRRYRQSIRAAERRAGAHERVDLAQPVDVAHWAIEEVTGDLLHLDGAYRESFQRRVDQRWGGGLASIRLQITLGVHLNNLALKSVDSSKESPREFAVARVHAGGLLLASEILELLRNGFAPGAEALSRSLHEAAVIARVLESRSWRLSRRFLDQDWVERAKAAEDGRMLGPPSSLRGAGREALKELQRRRDDAIQEHGRELLSTTGYGWAAPAGPKKKPPTFKQLESMASMKRRRKSYASANDVVHMKPIVSRALRHPLESEVQFIGPREDGVYDVGISSANYLTDLHVSLLNAAPGIAPLHERYVLAGLAHRLAEDAAADLGRAHLSYLADVGIVTVPEVSKGAGLRSSSIGSKNAAPSALP